MSTETIFFLIALTLLLLLVAGLTYSTYVAIIEIFRDK